VSPAEVEPEAPARPAAEAGLRVRPAAGDDVPAVVKGLERLLVELGGKRPTTEEMEAEAQALVDDPTVGALLVAEAEGEIVGVLAASWQRAIHVPGRYGTIQDLWVDPAWRSRAVGHDLVEALAETAREQGVGRLEVGLPRESFAAIAATERFYEGNGFAPLGPRMRRLLR
jgi:GNAT superfamily N-acetyltransferase